MSFDIEAFAKSAGIPVDLFKSGLGGVLTFLKDHLPDGMFGQVKEKVPEAQAMMDDATAKAPAGGGGGIIGAITGTVSAMLGASKGAADLVAKLTGLGLSMEQITTFLPKVLEFFKAILPPDLLGKVTDALKKGDKAS